MSVIVAVLQVLLAIVVVVGGAVAAIFIVFVLCNLYEEYLDRVIDWLDDQARRVADKLKRRRN